MALEKAGFRDVLVALNNAFPGKDVLTMQEVAAYMHIDRRTLLNDKQFPARLVGGRYAIHKAALARYLS